MTTIPGQNLKADPEVGGDMSDLMAHGRNAAPDTSTPPPQRVAVVTGGAQGLGSACVDALLAAGHRVAVVDLFQPDAAEYGCDGEAILHLSGDVTQPAQVDRIRQQVHEAFGPVSVLVNAAGIARSTRIEQISLEEWNAVLATSVTGSFLCTQAWVSDMRELGFGRVVNFSSTAGKNVSTLAGAHYTTAKAGLLGLTRAMAKELGPLGITVNAVCPGIFDTTMARGLSGSMDLEGYLSTLPIPRIGEPWEVGELVAFLASDRAGYITGASIDINGGELMV